MYLHDLRAIYICIYTAALSKYIYIYMNGDFNEYVYVWFDSYTSWFNLYTSFPTIELILKVIYIYEGCEISPILGIKGFQLCGLMIGFDYVLNPIYTKVFIYDRFDDERYIYEYMIFEIHMNMKKGSLSLYL